jgi:hypothetical protein
MLRGFGGKEGKRPLIIRSKRRCEDNIIMDVREIAWGVMDWIYLARDRDQWKGPTKCLEILE